MTDRHPWQSVEPPSNGTLGIEPGDAHNMRLIQNVRPPDWINPRPQAKYHLVVVGAGTGGLVSAAIAAGLGARVALVERHLMGGDCLNVGCVPSKALLRAARAWDEARTAAPRFGGPEANGDGSFAAVAERLRRLRADISPHDGASRFRGLGVDVFFGDGRFTGPDRLEVNGVPLHFRRAIIATGTRPAVPAVPGLTQSGYLTNETIFNLTELPSRLVVIGGGPVGSELAQAFARFGSRVEMLADVDRVLPHDDPDAAEIVQQALERDGVTFHRRARVTGVESSGDGCFVRFEAGGSARTVSADRLLIATGRLPNLEGLGLDDAAVAFTRDGVTTDHRLRTSNPRIYAVGDVASSLRFTHAADAQARVAVRNALFWGRQRADRLVIPWCTYTSPELAHVGLSAAAARARPDVETLTVPLDAIDRARLDDAPPGFLRVHLERGSDHILGATLVAEHAGELIGHLALAMTAGLGLDAIGEIVFPYPTQAEIFRRAADVRRRQRLTPRVKRVFGWYFRAVR